jgi:formylglycine-generating enzyme required for sulfatase activity
MVLLPAGWFMMGSNGGQDDEKPVHKVWINSFLIDKCEVTQKHFEQLMKKNYSHFKGSEHPTEQLAWGDAAKYCNARSRAEGLKPCYDEQTGACDFTANGYRLPTEAEWEYACRAGSKSDFQFGNDKNKLRNYAWFAENSVGKSHPVGRKKPNRWGIYDMHGNVAEWCNDVYEKTYYAEAAENSPRGPTEVATSKFVVRGGSWNSSASACRSAYRDSETPGQPDGCFARDDIGFRCVRNTPVGSKENVDG